MLLTDGSGCHVEMQPGDKSVVRPPGSARLDSQCLFQTKASGLGSTLGSTLSAISNTTTQNNKKKAISCQSLRSREVALHL